MIKGTIRLGKILTPPNTENGYRCDIEALDTNVRYQAICNPSPYGWALPEVGAIVYYLSSPFSIRIIGCLTDADERDLDAIYSQEALGSIVASMNPGDVYVGKYGRGSFPNTGDADIVSFSTRGRLFLEQKTGTSYLSGNNLDLFTNGQGIRVFTANAKGEGIGDTLTIQRNSTDEENPQNLTSISLDTSGSVALNVGYVKKDDPKDPQNPKYIPTTNLELSTIGELKAYLGGETFDDAVVSLKMDSPNKDISIKSFGVVNVYTGETTLEEAMVSEVLDATSKLLALKSQGKIQVYCGETSFDEAIASMLMDATAKEIRLKTTGSIYAESTGSTNIKAKNLVVSAKTDITGETSITGKTSVSGDFSVKGSRITLEGSGGVTIGGSGALALVVASKLIALFNAHTHTTSMGPSGPPIVPLAEPQVATIITKAK